MASATINRAASADSTSSSFRGRKTEAGEYIRLQYDIVKNYDFLFENIAFEGGGGKMVAYVGAIQVGSVLYRLLFYFTLISHYQSTAGGGLSMILPLHAGVEPTLPRWPRHIP